MVDFKFVYTLSHDNKVFYVGKTKNVDVRYGGHLTNKRDCELVKYIQSILQKGELPILNIITYAPDLEATDIEWTLIRCFTLGGHKLFNCLHDDGLRRPKNIINNKKEMYRDIRKKQQYFFEMSLKGGTYYRPSIRKVKL